MEIIVSGKRLVRIFYGSMCMSLDLLRKFINKKYLFEEEKAISSRNSIPVFRFREITNIGKLQYKKPII